ncbi:hypothetical protein ACLOJK_003141 [Asimina triloba]
MEENHDTCFFNAYDWEKDLVSFSTLCCSKEEEFPCVRGKGDEDGVCDDSPVCLPESRLVPEGFQQANSPVEECVMLVNAGGGDIEGIVSQLNFKGDFGFKGGDVIKTSEPIVHGGNYPLLYQSARYGDFCYRFDNLLPGYYFIDLHFVEIVNTNGPKGMRVFNVYIQEEKANSLKTEFLVCNNCSTKIEVSPAQNRARTVKEIKKYEKKIEELTNQCQLKSDECHEAWMSLSDANDQLETLRMEHDSKLYRAELLDRDMEVQAAQLRDISYRYKHDKNFWISSINNLQGKVKAMKLEHAQLSKEAHDCADSIPELSKMACGVQELAYPESYQRLDTCKDLKAKYAEELAKRKKLYNQVQEIKGNIRVFCRCRPLSKEEVSSGCEAIVDFDAAKDGELGILAGGSMKKTFKFERVYTPKDDQAHVFADASPMVVSVLDGYNVCIFAYGQTGTGKTFTMEGTEQNRGVNYRTLEELFKFSKEREAMFAYNISVSVLEVYNEQIRDLLATSPSSKRLEIRQAAEGFHHVPGIVEAKVKNIKEVWDVLQSGSNARAVGSNNVNEHSSRSHCMLCVTVQSKNLMNGECTKSKLWLVDLAGSERLARTDVQGERLKEAQNINRSLSALGDVISALAAKSSHIPYRNSKLTHLLQDSLGTPTVQWGDSKTLMFVQISPSEKDLGETLSSLNFASRVRGVELGPAKKQIDTSELQKMKQMLEKTKQDLRYKDECLRNLEENHQNLEGKLRSKDQTIRNQQERVKELEGQIQLKMELTQAQSEKKLSQLSEKVKGREEMCMALEQKVKELENQLKEQRHVESMALRQKVEELENKLREQRQQSETESAVLEQKVKELERTLKERDPLLGSVLLNSADRLPTATPNEPKAFSGCSITTDVLQVLRSSNRSRVFGLATLSGAASSNEIGRKRERRSGATGNSENNDVSIPASYVEKKGVQSELKRLRQVDSRKAAVGKMTRTSKVAAATTQKPLNHNKTIRENGMKDREKARGWLR